MGCDGVPPPQVTANVLPVAAWMPASFRYHSSTRLKVEVPATSPMIRESA